MKVCVVCMYWICMKVCVVCMYWICMRSVCVGSV